MPEPFFAYPIAEKDAGGIITGHLLHACRTLEAICQCLRNWHLKPHQVHACGWDNCGEWVIPTRALEQAMQGKGR